MTETTYIEQLRSAAAATQGTTGVHTVALCDDALAGSIDALIAVAKLSEPSLAAAQRRERVTSRYRCACCHEPAWNQVCLTCAPDQHPSMLDPLFDARTAFRSEPPSPAATVIHDPDPRGLGEGY